jgi:hypothetical protein
MRCIQGCDRDRIPPMVPRPRTTAKCRFIRNWGSALHFNRSFWIMATCLCHSLAANTFRLAKYRARNETWQAQPKSKRGFVIGSWVEAKDGCGYSRDRCQPTGTIPTMFRVRGRSIYTIYLSRAIRTPAHTIDFRPMLRRRVRPIGRPGIINYREHAPCQTWVAHS